MKVLILILAGVIAWAPIADAENLGSLFGAMATAQATGKGQTTFHGTVGLTDVNPFVGGIGYGFSDNVDGRVRLGIIDETAFETIFVVGADARWQMWDMESMAAEGNLKPFDMALGMFFERSTWNFDDTFDPNSDSKMTAFEIGFQATGSKTYSMSNGSTLTPYGRLNLRNEHITISSDGFEVSDSQLAVGVNAGVAWGVTERVNLMGELQIDGNDGLFLGVDYRP